MVDCSRSFVSRHGVVAVAARMALPCLTVSHEGRLPDVSIESFRQSVHDRRVLALVQRQATGDDHDDNDDSSESANVRTMSAISLGITASNPSLVSAVEPPLEPRRKWRILNLQQRQQQQQQQQRMMPRIQPTATRRTRHRVPASYNGSLAKSSFCHTLSVLSGRCYIQ